MSEQFDPFLSLADELDEEFAQYWIITRRITDYIRNHYSLKGA